MWTSWMYNAIIIGTVTTRDRHVITSFASYVYLRQTHVGSLVIIKIKKVAP